MGVVREPSWEWRDAEDVMAEIRGSQIMDGRIDGNELYLQFADQRVLVIVGLPALGVALVQSEKVTH